MDLDHWEGARLAVGRADDGSVDEGVPGLHVGVWGPAPAPATQSPSSPTDRTAPPTAAPGLPMPELLASTSRAGADDEPDGNREEEDQRPAEPNQSILPTRPPLRLPAN